MTPVHSYFFATLVIFGIGLVAGLLAIWLGAWRSTCIFLMLAGSTEVPRIWLLNWVRVTSWALVAVLSVSYATIWAGLVANHINYWFGLFTWGGWLVLRWQASNLAATCRIDKIMAKLDS